ncbi:mammalian cell entry protein [Mycobacterium deserti]|uniref:Mammalian cell entry protein n=1 Tax=Mycobacterium deserti TaxID=2978347 RepID=A0ABT2M9K3_9MYCO|nr:mammalian cell entry protein [Mycobacterium deserti]MCT7658942.1 mammalian cell entry protein [Mycobacterium deserti]
MEDQPADSGDLTTGTAETADEVSEAEGTRRKRRFSLRRRSKTAAPVIEPAEEAEPDTASAPRVPMGKSARTAKVQEAAVEPPEANGETASDTAENQPGVDDDQQIAETADAPEEAKDEPAIEPILVPYRPAGKRLTVAATAAGVLFVAAAGFAGATLQPYLADRAEVDTKLDVARTAASAISTLWTYTPDNMESLPNRSEGFLGGDFAHEYRKYIDAIVAPNKQAQVTNTTQVMGAAVETLTPTEATALVYTNSVATSPVTKNIPSLRYLSYRLTMQRHDAKWLITRMSTVTSFDLTPQL